MSIFRKISAVFAAGTLLTLAGCGGGGSNLATGQTGSQNASRGAVALNLQFAAQPTATKSRTAISAHNSDISMRTRAPYAGNIPYGALSVRVVVTDPATGAEVAPARLITRPATTSGVVPLVTVQYPALRIGAVKVDVAALPNDDGTGNALAVGSVTGQIAAQTTTTLTAPMTLTIDHITVSQKSISLDVVNNSAGFDAIPMDKNNQPLDYILQFVSADPDIVTVFPTGDTSAQVIRQSVRGASEILVYEPNGGVFATVSIFNQ